jgi:hypothetical protein
MSVNPDFRAYVDKIVETTEAAKPSFAPPAIKRDKSRISKK